MRKPKLGKRIMAAVMSFLLIVCMLPMDFSVVLAEGEDLAAILNFDLSGVETVGADINTDFAAGDFDIVASGNVQVQETSGITDANGIEFTRKLNTKGSGNAGRRAVKFTLPYSANVEFYFLSTAGEGRNLTVADSTGAEIASLAAAAKIESGAIEPKSVTLAAGEYTVYPSGNIDIFDIRVVRTLRFDLSKVETVGADINTDFAAGDFNIVASGNVQVQETSGITDTNGNEFTRKLNTKGSGNTGRRAVKFTLPYSANVDLYFLSTAGEGRNLTVADSTGREIASLAAAAKIESGAIEPKSVTLAAGEYTVYPSGNIDIFDIRVKRAMRFDLSGVETVGADINTDFAAGDFNIVASGNVQVQETSGITDANGNEFTRKLNTKGSGNTGRRAVKFNIDYITTLEFYFLSTAGEGRNLTVADSTGTEVTSMAAAAKIESGAVQPKEVTLLPGEYTVYPSGNIDIFDIRIKSDSKPLVPWDEVETPVINSVTVNDDGNFVVDFDAVIDKAEGAEYVMVSMVSNGNEVSSVKVGPGSDTSAVMIPYWNGNYTFTATAVRAGEAQKASAPYAVNDFVLSLKRPVFNMLESAGGGSVYVDWINNDEAEKYVVEYKESGAADYTTAATVTDGHYTITGLTVGNTYNVKVTAQAGTAQASYDKDITVSADATHQWYAAITGSAQVSDMTVTQEGGASQNYKFSVEDSTQNKTNLAEAADITNTAGTVTINNAADGKISDDEDGFQYYFTRINPNTENFVMEATFRITDTSRTPDNQSGIGIFAADILGINNYGPGTYTHKYFNSVSSLYYSSRSSHPSLRYITGYVSSDASNNDSAERVNNRHDFTAETSFTEGNTYTFKLAKTNDAYVATFDGQELVLDDTSVLSVQDDGSICVGVFAVRKVSVEITDIKFETSESTGVAGGSSNTVITPDARVYSSNTVGSKTYEYIYVPNCAGKLTVEGTDFVERDVAANEVVRVNVELKTGNNTVRSTFVPNAGENISSTNPIVRTTNVECKQYGKEGETIIVSPDGTADGLGTEESPLNLATAVRYAQPGQVLWLKNGTYTGGATINRSVSGTAQKPITMVAETPGSVLLQGAGINLIGSYWHIYGIYVKDAAGVGIQISGNNNTVEMCTVEHSSNSGIQISRSGSADNDAGINGRLWPSDNLVKNCESFDNVDPGRNDADGFAAKLTCGNGNRFYGCIGHNNIDDGWDLYAKSTTGKIGVVTIENCVAYNNGWLTTEDTTAEGYEYGEGNGFKLGGGYLEGGHILKNSISFNNNGKGITSNSCPDCQVINCISYNNSRPGSKAYNVGLNAKASAEKKWVVQGLISMADPADTELDDLIPFALQSENNYIYNGSDSYNTLGEKAVAEWFENVDTSVAPGRAADGTINMHGLLNMVSGSPENSGARLDVTSDAAKSVQPQKTTVVSGVSDPEPGDVIVDTEPGENAPEIAVEMTEEIKDAILTEEDKQLVESGSEIKITLAVEDAEETVSEEDKTAVTNALGEFQKGQYLDISLLKVIDNGAPTPISTVLVPLKITISIPENLKNSTVSREFAVIRVHNGTAVVLEDKDSDPDTITIETDQFSTYALVYKDVNTEQPTQPEQPTQSEDSGQSGDSDDGDKPEESAQPAPTQQQPTQPQEPAQSQPAPTDKTDEVTSAGTGDRTPIVMYAAFAFAGMAVLAGYALRLKKSRMHK